MKRVGVYAVVVEMEVDSIDETKGGGFHPKKRNAVTRPRFL
jgi:hypothetical protein